MTETSVVENTRREQIRKALTGAGLKEIDPAILAKCTCIKQRPFTQLHHLRSFPSTHIFPGLAVALSFSISPKQMAECWEAFSLNRNLKDLDEHSFESYRKALIKEFGTGINGGSAEIVTASSGAITSLGKRTPLPSVTPPAKRAHQASLQHQAQRTPATSSDQARRISYSPAPPGALGSATPSNRPKYGDRDNAGKVIATYNPRNLDSLVLPNPGNHHRCKISYDFETNVTSRYRHLFSTIDDRSKALDRHLTQLGDAMIEKYGLGKEQENENGIAGLEGVGVPRQEKICCIGRICNSAHEGRINATSIVLEGDRKTSGGARVDLDLQYLKSTKTPYSLFSGQIVAVEGMNTSGRKLVAHRICEGAPYDPNTSSVRDLMRYHHDDSFQGGMGLKLFCVSGPYTANDNFNYEPLIDLMGSVKVEKPDVVVMTGPFVDMNHPAVQSGEATLEFEGGDETIVPYEAFFANKVANLLEELFVDDDCHTQFVLVPSIDDANAEWVFPQPPFANSSDSPAMSNIPGGEGIELGSLGLELIETAGRENSTPKRVHCVSNPCTFKVNETVIGVTSNDAIFHISADETNSHLEPGSRLGRIAQHMLQQRCYYPLFPGKTNLDLKHMDQVKMPCQPDVLIVPSKLTSFTRNVLGSIVINPGMLTKDTTGGTYGVLDIEPISREILEEAGGLDVQMKHSIPDRSRVEIKRI